MVEKIVPYSNLKLNFKPEKKEVSFKDTKILINQYITTKDAYDLLMISLQEAKEDGYYNPFTLDIYFHLNLVYMFTNVHFSPEDKEDPFALYDVLDFNGFIDMVLENIPDDIYSKLINMLEEIVGKAEKYNISTACILNEIITDLPKNAAAAADIVNNFDPNKYEAVQRFAVAANGGRDIKTNLPVTE